MGAFPHAVEHDACSMVPVQQDAFIHALQAHMVALTQQMCALQMQNEHLLHENSCLKSLVPEHSQSEFASDLGCQERFSQASLDDDESESQPELIEIKDDD